MKSCGGSIQSTVHDLNDETLGTCETFEEKQIGGERDIYITIPGFIQILPSSQV